ncbi:hypothetical protein [Mycoplasma buteonis]|uniref:hypothetical protein n=1 Tax=Mycoplasma buteonis TaxID=171280 RepID=UPI000563F067|nr:hypothetical protein [Mycoplasma buteonis]
MKQGLKKFSGKTQGGRTKEGQKIGENFIKEVLEVLQIEDLKLSLFKKRFIYENGIDYKTSQYPDFIIANSKTGSKLYKNVKYFFLESKFKQISGSDWEKLECNFGYHDFFYNDLLNLQVKTIVILTGYWKELEKKYPLFMYYFKQKYGKECIFDFGSNVKEIFRFAKFLNVECTEEIQSQLIKIYNKYQNLE